MTQGTTRCNAKVMPHATPAGESPGTIALLESPLKINDFEANARVYLHLQQRLADHLRTLINEKYSLALDTIPIEIPPELKFGELATPIALQLARTLRKAPKIIAQEIVVAIVADLGHLPGFARFEVAGAGYINAHIDRAAAVREIASEPVAPASRPAVAGASSPPHRDHVLVEHTSINPNKAAHIGHLRNAILGDTFVRMLRAAGHQVDIQNYIDNTGVQVADVVVGFLHIEGQTPAQIRALIAECERRAVTEGPAAAIDYYCWDLTPAPPPGTTKARPKKTPSARNSATRPSILSKKATMTRLRSPI